MKWSLIDANLLIDKLYLINETVFLIITRVTFMVKNAILDAKYQM